MSDVIFRFPSWIIKQRGKWNKERCKWLVSEYKYPSGGIIIIGIEKILATERCYHATSYLLITRHNISHYPGNYILRWLNVRKSTTRETEASSTTPVNY